MAGVTVTIADLFTFHNVSINTIEGGAGDTYWWTLHSTMFLLIHETVGLSPTDVNLYIPQCFY